MQLSTPAPERGCSVLVVLLFGWVVGFHAWGVFGVGWRALNLPGGEFRQAQTAVASYWMRAEGDYRLAYPLPVLGKPWSVPMEFPLYQWTVVGVSNLTGLELTKAGRLASIICFYLCLPVLFLLLARLGLDWRGRLVVLAPVAGCPLHIFYARAFLIETMALLLSLVFLWAYLHAVSRRHWGWAALGAIAGVGAGLVKVTTFVLLLLPACGWTLFSLWQTRMQRGQLLAVAAWGLGMVVAPVAAVFWWLDYTDAVRALNPAADFLSPESMHRYYFGSGVRFSWDLWQRHFAILGREIAPWWVLGLGAGLAATCGRRWWAWLLGLVGLFFSVQVIFPVLYAWHEYYYMANTFALMLALGLACWGAIESRLPRWLAWALVLAVTAGQSATYLRVHKPMQEGTSRGGTSLTRTLSAVTEPAEVLVIAGNDWSAITPFFARRKALMIRNGREDNPEFLRRAFAALRPETVGAIVLHGAQQNNQLLLGLAREYFGRDFRHVYSADGAAVFLPENRAQDAAQVLGLVGQHEQLVLTDETKAVAASQAGQEVRVDRATPIYSRQFHDLEPRPWKVYSLFGLARFPYQDADYLRADPVTKLWFRVPPGRHTVSIVVGMIPSAYADDIPAGDRSDGIEVALTDETDPAAPRVLFSRVINPRDNPADRRIQTLECPLQFERETNLQLGILPGPSGSLARDWTMLGPVRIR